jgi:hypothetical protein
MALWHNYVANANIYYKNVAWVALGTLECVHRGKASKRIESSVFRREMSWYSQREIS